MTLQKWAIFIMGVYGGNYLSFVGSSWNFVPGYNKKRWHTLWKFQLEITSNTKVIAKKPLTNLFEMNSRPNFHIECLRCGLFDWYKAWMQLIFFFLCLYQILWLRIHILKLLNCIFTTVLFIFHGCLLQRPAVILPVTRARFISHTLHSYMYRTWC